MALTIQDLEKQIAELRKQNEALKANGNGAKPFRVETGSYNGAPTLAFSGNFKPWRKGARSIAEIVRNLDTVRAALKECGVSVDKAA